MADLNNLKDKIKDTIKPNGVGNITGGVLQTQMIDVIDQLNDVKIDRNSTSILDDINFYPKDETSWEYGTITSDGQDGVITGGRVRTSYIDVQSISSPLSVKYGESVFSSCQVDIFFYDKDKRFIVESAYVRDKEFSLDEKTGYIRILYMKKPDSGGVIMSDVVKKDIFVGGKKIGNIYPNNLSLRVSQWNVGLLDYGTGNKGIPNNELEEKVPGLKKVITEENADFFIINEFPIYLDRNSTIDFYQEILKPFYPYYTVVQSGYPVAVASKYPYTYRFYFSEYTGKNYILGDIAIRNQIISFCALHPRAAAAYSQQRKEEFTKLIQLLSNKDKVLFAGDLNTSYDNELDPFRNAGYTLGNRGYWGSIMTYPADMASLDNIIVKGMRIDNYSVGKEASVSDHLPTSADINIIE